jgi:hypothetical protein
MRLLTMILFATLTSACFGVGADFFLCPDGKHRASAWPQLYNQ